MRLRKSWIKRWFRYKHTTGEAFDQGQPYTVSSKYLLLKTFQCFLFRFVYVQEGKRVSSPLRFLPKKKTCEEKEIYNNFSLTSWQVILFFNLIKIVYERNGNQNHDRRSFFAGIVQVGSQDHEKITGKIWIMVMVIKS